MIEFRCVREDGSEIRYAIEEHSTYPEVMEAFYNFSSAMGYAKKTIDSVFEEDTNQRRIRESIRELEE